ncbi:MAG: MBL fold metallo-hydrolase [Gammaproteobacteria bacterium]|nr:MBL fold metallo-hydrolase [Gammaproteobacteria bacterium]
MKLSFHDLGWGITCIETYFHREGLAGCYLVQQGEAAALIDTGTAYTTPNIMELLELRNIQPKQVRYVIPTHVHLDHAGGAGQLMEQLPNASLVVHPLGVRHLTDPGRLTAGATAVYGEEQFYNNFKELLPVPRERVIEATDQLSIDLNGRRLVCLDSPGHARHHNCIWDETSRGFFTGDTFGIAYPELATDQGPFMLLPSTPVQFDPEAWHKTLNRLMSYNPERMFLTHYCGVEQPEILSGPLHEEIDAYVDIALSSNGEKRQEMIRAKLDALYFERLEQHGSKLSNEQIHQVLDMDLGLCAQGLEVWLQRRESQPA